jgi:hypothetical protein
VEGRILLKISLGRLVTKCVKGAYLGLTFVRCAMGETHEDVVNDRLILARDSIKVLDPRK